MKELNKQFLARVRDHNCTLCQPLLDDVIDKRSLVASYRPVLSLADRSLYGNLVMVRGPADSPVRSIDRLFALASNLGLMAKFSKRYLDAVLFNFVDAKVPGRLLLPIPNRMIEDMGGDWVELMEKALKKYRLDRDKVVVIHPGIVSDAENAIRNAVEFVAAAKKLGLALGAGTMDCERNEKLLWSRAALDIVLLDEGQFSGIASQLLPLPNLTRRIAAETGNKRLVMATDLASASELKTAWRVGVRLVCGEIVGRQDGKPAGVIPAGALKVLQEVWPNADPEPQTELSKYFLNKLLFTPPVVSQKTTSDEVLRLFEQNPELRAVAVVEDKAPIGLISRFEMLDNMARPYRHELYGRKSCARFMDREALSADIRIDLAELSDQVTRASPKHLISGFIITDRGNYLGMGSVQDLMRAITTMQLDAARYANPLTQLPGNVPINKTIDSLLLARVPFNIAYCDLDHFKPFNDVFGYAKGDALIVLAARILAEHCDPELDFLGHVGGDDFVLIMRSPDWIERCRRMLAGFEREIGTFFPAEAREAGGYEALNRHGEIERFPLTSLSIGAAEIEPGVFESHLEVAGTVTETKKRAKQMPGNSFYLNQRRYGETA